MSEQKELLSFEDALKAFISQTKSQQLAVLVKMVSLAEAEEILQEAYLKIYLLLSKNPNKEKPLEQFMLMQPLLYSMAENLAISNLRHQKVVRLHSQKNSQNTSIFDTTQTQSVEFDLIRQDQNNLMLRAINHLPPICRQVFVQRKIHSKSHKEIATILGISTKTVESHLSKGLALCKDFVTQEKVANIIKKSRVAR